MISLLCKVAWDRRIVEIPIGREKTLRGKLHDEWNQQSFQCLITTVDLKDAYKQLGVHEADRNKAIVTVRCREKPFLKMYAVDCLPFGASSSVHSFNRVARMIWAIGVQELRLPWLSYFDDCPMISLAGIQESSLASAKTMLHLVGFKYAESKLIPFNQRAEVLGVTVDCSDAEKNILRFKMKDSRRCEILESLKEIIANGWIIPCQLPSILGRVQFGEGQLSGRAGKLAMADIRTLGLQSRERVSLTESGRLIHVEVKIRNEQT